MEKSNRERMFWNQIISIIMFIAVVVALLWMSVVSYFQTEGAFREMNDADIILFNFKIGNYISYMLAILFQYGQNLALFIRKHFLTEILKK